MHVASNELVGSGLAMQSDQARPLCASRDPVCTARTRDKFHQIDNELIISIRIGPAEQLFRGAHAARSYPFPQDPRL